MLRDGLEKKPLSNPSYLRGTTSICQQKWPNIYLLGAYLRIDNAKASTNWYDDQLGLQKSIDPFCRFFEEETIEKLQLFERDEMEKMNFDLNWKIYLLVIFLKMYIARISTNW